MRTRPLRGRPRVSAILALPALALLLAGCGPRYDVGETRTVHQTGDCLFHEATLVPTRGFLEEPNYRVTVDCANPALSPSRYAETLFETRQPEFYRFADFRTAAGERRLQISYCQFGDMDALPAVQRRLEAISRNVARFDDVTIGAVGDPAPCTRDAICARAAERRGGQVCE
jgi:hypothetical protein